VVVGDQKVIEPGIRALNLGTVKVMSVDEVFGIEKPCVNASAFLMASARRPRPRSSL
jgi:hypothetical protein